MDTLQTVLALLVTLGILVTFHEYGHYIVARKFGVKVLRFSVGFGKPLYTWKNKEGTEFCVAAIPLGGYVKMLDEREQTVAENEKHLAFNNKSPGQRIAIAAAGPIANFIFAVLAYWLMFVVGFNAVRPVVGEVLPNSIAEKSGLEPGFEFVSVNGRTTPSWREVSIAFADQIGETGSFEVELSKIDLNRLESDDSEALERRPIELSAPQTFKFVLDKDWQENDPENLMEDIGIKNFLPNVPAILDIVQDGPGKRSGLEVGDLIVGVDGEKISGWHELVKVLQRSPGVELAIQVERPGVGLIELLTTPDAHETESGKVIGRIGVGARPFSYPEGMIKTVRLGPGEAVVEAFEQMQADTVMTLNAIRKMVVGLLSLENLSGPITIAQVANQSISSGFEHFMGLLALLSVSLGVLNLLPIPVLDGGHILFYTAEAIRGKPLPDAVQEFGLKIGLSLVLALMVIAFYNDIMRL